MEVSDGSTDVGVPLRALITLLSKMLVSLPIKMW